MCNKANVIVKKDPVVSVVVPSFQADHTLPQVVSALLNSSLALNIFVIKDAGSRTGDNWLPMSDRISLIRLLGNYPFGPAYARNRGAELAKDSEYLCFVDADVVVNGNTIAQMISHLDTNSDCAAVFGSYDQTPADPGLISQYRNLLHHHTHQGENNDCCTFWSGIGVIRRAVFMAVGGFDETYRQPSVEDIDLGLRLHRHGFQITILPSAQGKHLKRWTLKTMIGTDFFRRGLPWSALLLTGWHMPDSLCLRWRERWSALVCVGSLLALPAVAHHPRLLLLIILLFSFFMVLQQSFFRLVVNRLGWLKFIVVSLLHWFYYINASAAFATALLLKLLLPKRRFQKLLR